MFDNAGCDILIEILPGFSDDELSNYNEQQQRIAGEVFNRKCQRKNNRIIKTFKIVI